jgi:cytochrome c biogenesis protein CcmG/thiol:disulfide interchange protein DsbE
VTGAIRTRSGALGRTTEILIVAAALLITGGCSAATGVSPGALAASRPAGDAPQARNFSLTELGRGGRVSLTAYAGRPLILNFFASWCAPCQRETPLLARFYAGHHGRVAVLGIDANDTAAAALRFLRKSAVGYPVGADPFPASTATSYGVLALPQTFFLSARHRIVWQVVGPVTRADLTRGVALMDARPDRG